MVKAVGGHARAWMLCTVALLWAWEAAADDPEPASTEAVTSAEAAGDLSTLWASPATTATRIPAPR